MDADVYNTQRLDDYMIAQHIELCAVGNIQSTQIYGVHRLPEKQNDDVDLFDRAIQFDHFMEVARKEIFMLKDYRVLVCGCWLVRTDHTFFGQGVYRVQNLPKHLEIVR